MSIQDSLDSLAEMLDQEFVEREILAWAYNELKELYGVETDEEVRKVWLERNKL